MRFKQIITLVLTVACLFTRFEMSVSAENVSTYPLVSGASPLYEVASNISSRLDIVGTAAECRSQADGKGVIHITVEQTLQKYSGWFWIWNNVDGASWTRTENRGSICLVSTKSGLTSGTYRVKSVFTLTDKNGKTETITVYSSEQKV